MDSTAQLTIWDQPSASATAATARPWPAPRPISPGALELRDYQAECNRAIADAGPGNWLVQMATGLGKTVTFASLMREPRVCQGRMLIASHREELVNQPVKYFSGRVGIERAAERSRGEAVISASFQTLFRRKERFRPDEFDTFIIDEAHHGMAPEFREVIEYFTPRLRLGFTATPNRADGVGLQYLFDKIIFQRDLRWGIEHGWLAPLDCLRAVIGWDLSQVRSRMGDYAPGDLNKAVNIEGANKAIAKLYHERAIGPTLIFGVSIEHCRSLAELIPGAAAAWGNDPLRAEKLRAFERGQVNPLINCNLFTEGTDFPFLRTLIMARPTKSVSAYVQMVGRVLRILPGVKERGLLIDCVDNSRLDLCSAPCLIGLETADVPERYRSGLVGDLLADLPALIERSVDTPESWIRAVKQVDLWAKKESLDLKGINWFRYPDGAMSVDLAGKKWLKVTAPDLRGQARVMTSKGWRTEPMALQECINAAFGILTRYMADERPLWSVDSFKRWGRAEASEKQKALCERMLSRKYPGFKVAELTKGEASLILRRVMGN